MDYCEKFSNVMTYANKHCNLVFEPDLNAQQTISPILDILHRQREVEKMDVIELHTFCDIVLHAYTKPACVTSLTQPRRAKLVSYCQELENAFGVFKNIQQMSAKYENAAQYCLHRVYEMSLDHELFDMQQHRDFNRPTDAEIVAAVFCGHLDQSV